MPKDKKNILKDFSHNMIKEVYEQPGIIKNLIEEHIDVKKKKIIFKDFGIDTGKMKKINRIVFLGCGTSFHASLIGRYVLAEYAGIESEVEFADEFIGRKAKVDNKTLVIAVSQSGETGDVIKAVKLAKKQKAVIVCITNGIDSTLDKLSNYTIFNQAGKEFALAATKTFTSQLLLMTLFAIFLGQNFQKTKQSVVVKILNEIIKLPKKIDGILKQNVNLQIVANKYYKLDNILILGKYYQYPLALEAALKLKETTYMHSEGFAAGEFSHGPLAICDKNRPCLFFAPQDNNFNEMKALVKRVKDLKRKVICITNVGNRQLIKQADTVIFVPKTLNLFFPLLAIISIQILAYHITLLKGINPDKPRFLTKFVI